MAANLANMRGTTGEADGAALYQRDLQRRMEFSQPQDKYEFENPEGVKDAYNRMGAHIDPYGGPPVKYTGDTPQKDAMVYRQQVRDAINEQVRTETRGDRPPGGIRTDPLTDEEVAYRKQMDDVGELAKFEAYVRAGWGGRDKMDMILKEYPQLIAREVDQINTDAKFALRCKLIDLYGCREFDDIPFQFARDQGYIKGPRLMHSDPIDSKYQGGVMSPFTYARKRAVAANKENTMNLPYSNVNEGPKYEGRAQRVPLGNLEDNNVSMYKSGEWTGPQRETYNFRRAAEERGFRQPIPFGRAA